MIEGELKSLIIKAKNGDKEAFGLVYTELLTPIYRYVYFRIREKEKAEDITQEVFFKIFKSLDSIKVSENGLLKYFYTVARNLLIDSYRKEVIQNIDPNEIDDTHADDSAINQEKVILERDNAEVLKRALGRISESEADILTLKFMHDFSNKEIGEITGKSEEAVRQLQSRGLKALREILSKEDFI